MYILAENNSDVFYSTNHISIFKYAVHEYFPIAVFRRKLTWESAERKNNKQDLEIYIFFLQNYFQIYLLFAY